MSLQYKLDNEFDLVFVVAYQKILQLSYVDKFLNDIHLEFRDKYKNELSDGKFYQNFNFLDTYNATLRDAEKWSQLQAKQPKQMRTFEESLKSKKTVASMIERKGEDKNAKNVKKTKEVNGVDEGMLLISIELKNQILIIIEYFLSSYEIIFLLGTYYVLFGFIL